MNDNITLEEINLGSDSNCGDADTIQDAFYKSDLNQRKLHSRLIVLINKINFLKNAVIVLALSNAVLFYLLLR